MVFGPSCPHVPFFLVIPVRSPPAKAPERRETKEEVLFLATNAPHDIPTSVPRCGRRGVFDSGRRLEAGVHFSRPPGMGDFINENIAKVTHLKAKKHENTGWLQVKRTVHLDRWLGVDPDLRAAFRPGWRPRVVQLSGSMLEGRARDEIQSKTYKDSQQKLEPLHYKPSCQDQDGQLDTLAHDM